MRRRPSTATLFLIAHPGAGVFYVQRPARAEMIMSRHCENCGCAIRSGYCTNCQEEAYIAFAQAPEMEFSEEFMRAAFQQDSESRNREAS